MTADELQAERDRVQLERERIKLAREREQERERHRQNIADTVALIMSVAGSLITIASIFIFMLIIK